MNLPPLTPAFQLSDMGIAGIAVLGILGVIFFFAMVWASRYTKVGPNEVLVVSGRKHRTRRKGSRTTRFPHREGRRHVRSPGHREGGHAIAGIADDRCADAGSLHEQGRAGESGRCGAIKVKGDDVSIATAAEQFLSKSTAAIMNIAMQTMEGHLRAILGTMTVEDIYQNRDAFAQKVQEVAAGDMANMGLGIVSFTIRDIRDSQGYLDALGKPRIAQVKRDAQIAQAEADRDAMIKSPRRTQAGQEAKFAGGHKDRRSAARLSNQPGAVPGDGEPEEGRGRSRV